MRYGLFFFSWLWNLEDPLLLILPVLNISLQHYGGTLILLVGSAPKPFEPPHQPPACRVVVGVSGCDSTEAESDEAFIALVDELIFRHCC